MTIEYSDQFRFEGHIYEIDAQPLEAYFHMHGGSPFHPLWPIAKRGYVANWAIEQDKFVLSGVWAAGEVSLDSLFLEHPDSIVAEWYSGPIHGRSGPRRYTGHPYRSFSNREIVLR